MKKVTEIAYGPSFYPGVVESELYRQQFLRYGLIFNITIFGNLKKVPEVAYRASFYTKRSKLSYYFRSICSGFWDTGRFFLNFSYLSIWNLKFEERSKSCICTIFLYHGIENELSFDLRAAIFEVGPIFTISIFGHKMWNFQRVAHELSFNSSAVQMEIIFGSMGSSFRDTACF